MQIPRRSDFRQAAAVAAVGALLAAAVAGARADDIRPASPTYVPAATRPAEALQADALLSSFPRNASVIPARNDAKALTLEGRVRDVRQVTTHGSETEMRVVLVGKSQADDTPAHFTCHIASDSADAAMTLKPDMVVRLTGAVGTVLPAQDRIDLLRCHDLSEPISLTLAEKLIGHWSADVSGNSATGSGSSVTRVDMTFASDSTFTQEAFNDTQSVRKLTGRWHLNGKDDGPQTLRLQPKSHPDSEAAVQLDDGKLTFTPTGLSDLKIHEVTAKEAAGIKFEYESRAMKDQVAHWLAGNMAPAAQTQMRTNIATSVDNMGSSWYAVEMGSSVLTSKHPTQLLVYDAKMFVLPYSTAQAAHAGIDAPDVRFTAIHGTTTLMVPEVKVESLTLDNRGIEPGKAFTGKVSYRTLGKPLADDYVLVMSSMQGTLTARFKKPPGPDFETYDFSFDGQRITTGYALRDPIAVVFAIGRVPKTGTDRSVRVISEPQAQLVDLIKN